MIRAVVAIALGVQAAALTNNAWRATYRQPPAKWTKPALLGGLGVVLLMFALTGGDW